MADQKIRVRQPSEFKHGQDFTTWYLMFCNFAEAVTLDIKDYLPTLKSYVDVATFATLQKLTISDTNKGDAVKLGVVLEKALSRDTIPPRLALKYRTQKVDEDLSSFSLELGKLASWSGMARCARRQQPAPWSGCTRMTTKRIAGRKVRGVMERGDGVGRGGTIDTSHRYQYLGQYNQSKPSY